MFNKIKEFFIGKPVEVQVPAPYKVEAEAVAAEVTKVSEQAVQAVVESIAPAKKPAAKKPAAKKPRTPKAAK